MIPLLLLGIALALVGCRGGAHAPATDAEPQTSSTPSTKAPAVDEEPRVDVVTARTVLDLDVAPGEAPSAEHPLGSVWVSVVVDDRGFAQARMFAWDVESGSVVARTRHDLVLSDKVYVGEPNAASIATASSHVYMITTMRNWELVALEMRSVDGGHAKAILPGGRDARIAASGEDVVAAWWRSTPAGLRLELRAFDADLHERGHRVLAQEKFAYPPTLNEHDLVVLGRRAYFIAGGKVLAFALPSLEPVATYPSGGQQLFVRDGRLFLQRATTLVELTADLAVVSERPGPQNRIALGPSGEALTSVGFRDDGPGHMIPALHEEARCTPIWSGTTPLLACAIEATRGPLDEPGGAKIVRLAVTP